MQKAICDLAMFATSTAYFTVTLNFSSLSLKARLLSACPYYKSHLNKPQVLRLFGKLYPERSESSPTLRRTHDDLLRPQTDASAKLYDTKHMAEMIIPSPHRLIARNARWPRLH